MSTNLERRVEALENAVQSLVKAVNLLEELFEKSSGLRGSKKPAAKTKKRAPGRKRVSKK